MKTYIVQQTKRQLHNNFSKHDSFQNTSNCMGPLSDENKLQIEQQELLLQKNNKN